MGLTRQSRLHSRGVLAERVWVTLCAVGLVIAGSARASWSRARDAAHRMRLAAISVGSGSREAMIALIAYGLYSAVRGLWGGSLEEGRRNAAALIDLEERLGISIEAAAQDLFVDHGLGMPFWNTFYVASQVVVLPLTLFLVYRHRRESYAFLRNMAILSWTAGVVWYALQPVAPPRLVDGPIVDTVSDGSLIDLNSTFIQAFYNPVAAMPSLHVGMAPVVAWALWRLTPHMWSRLLGLLYPVLVVVAIVVTGNHFVLDIAGGLAVVLPAAAIAWLLSNPPRLRHGSSGPDRAHPGTGPGRSRPL